MKESSVGTERRLTYEGFRFRFAPVGCLSETNRPCFNATHSSNRFTHALEKRITVT